MRKQQFKDYSEKLTIAESDLAGALMALEQEKLSRQNFEDNSAQDITDLRSKLADALALDGPPFSLRKRH